MIEPILSPLASFSIPIPVTLACACVCAYMLGKIPKDLQDKRKPKKAEQPESRSSDCRADNGRRSDKLIHKLITEVEEFHRDLEVHTQSLQQLRSAINNFEQGDIAEVNDEAKQTLRSIERHCEEMPRVFDAIRQTTKAAVESIATASANE